MGCVSLNGINYLNDHEVDKLLNDKNEKYRKSLI